MKKKIAALLLCAVLSATSFPVTGMAGEFSAASEDVSQETPDPEITPTVKPARTPKVTASVVKGLEKPLKFYPGQFYEFKVIGAGTDNKSPVKGAVRWIPLYWSMSSVGDRLQLCLENWFTCGNINWCLLYYVHFLQTAGVQRKVMD